MGKNEKKEFKSSLESIAASSIIVFISIIISKILTWTYTITIARYYGPEIFGLYTLSLMTIGWLMIFTRLGLNNGLLRYISFFRGKRYLLYLERLFS